MAIAGLSATLVFTNGTNVLTFTFGNLKVAVQPTVQGRELEIMLPLAFNAYSKNDEPSIKIYERLDRKQRRVDWQVGWPSGGRPREGCPRRVISESLTCKEVDGMSRNVIQDGYTREGYIEASDRLNDELSFSYRPMFGGEPGGTSLQAFRLLDSAHQAAEEAKSITKHLVS